MYYTTINFDGVWMFIQHIYQLHILQLAIKITIVQFLLFVMQILYRFYWFP